MANLSQADVEELLATTRFSRREIADFGKHGVRVSHEEFGAICQDAGLEGSVLRDALWSAFDHDGDGEVSVKELVTSLSKLTRGTLADLSSVFFRMYDLDGDAHLNIDEVITVYAALYQRTTGTRDEVGDAPLSEAQCARIRSFVGKADTDGDGKLSEAEFTEAVKALAASADGAGGGDAAERRSMRAFFRSPRNLWLAFVTSWFEIGTSFCLPAMGALSLRVQHRFGAGDKDIGALVGFYYAGSMVGPLFGGQWLNKIGPAKTIVIANVIVGCGALLQALADGASELPVLNIARIIIGFGGLITPFCTIEVLNRLFPDHFMFMAGFRNLIQSASGYGAFVVLPALADSYGTDPVADPDAYNKGTGMGLWFCFYCAVASLAANVYVWLVYMRGDGPAAGAGAGAAEGADASPRRLAAKLRELSGAVRPRAPGKWADWKLPLSFFLSTFGIQAQYFAPFAFTAFSVKIYSSKFGMSATEAANLSGIMNLFGGLLGPVAGPFSDWLGLRAASLSAFGLFTVAGFALLAVGARTSATVWVATVLFALTYGFGDTVAYPNIRLLVGAERAGIGYGIFGFMGGLFAVVVPVVGGLIFDAEADAAPQDTGEQVCWYFAGLAALASILWWLVHVLEGANSAIELPASKMVELSDYQIEAAALAGIGGGERSDSNASVDVSNPALGVEPISVRIRNETVAAGSSSSTALETSKTNKTI